MSKTTFEITEDHLKLTRRMFVGWGDCEYGAPSIDCKRPYGNSDVEGDIAEILGISDNRRHKDDEPFFTEEDLARIRKIHKEMETVLQIILCVQKFETGKYIKKEEYSSLSWRKA